MPNNLSAHVVSVLAFISGLVAVVHPGFHIDPALEKEIVAGVVLLVGAMQSFHINLKKVWLQGYNAYQQALLTTNREALAHAQASAQQVTPSGPVMQSRVTQVTPSGPVVTSTGVDAVIYAVVDPAIAEGSGAEARPQ